MSLFHCHPAITEAAVALLLCRYPADFWPLTARYKVKPETVKEPTDQLRADKREVDMALLFSRR